MGRDLTREPEYERAKYISRISGSDGNSRNMEIQENLALCIPGKREGLPGASRRMKELF